jgi:hypothetical protein
LDARKLDEMSLEHDLSYTVACDGSVPGALTVTFMPGADQPGPAVVPTTLWTEEYATVMRAKLEVNAVDIDNVRDLFMKMEKAGAKTPSAENIYCFYKVGNHNGHAKVPQWRHVTISSLHVSLFRLGPPTRSTSRARTLTAMWSRDS